MKLLFRLACFLVVPFFVNASYAQCTATITLHGPDTSCINTGTYLTTAISPGVPSSYRWQQSNNNLLWVNINGANTDTLIPQGTGWYRAVDSAGTCGAYSPAIHVVINPFPPSGITHSNCGNLPDTLWPPSCNTCTYNWNIPGAALGGYYVASNNGTYIVYTTNQYGCTVIDTAVLPVVVIPVISAAICNGPVCPGASAQLSATAIPTGVSYHWTGPNNMYSSQQHVSLANVNAAMAGTYTVKAAINGCYSAPASTILTLLCQDSVWPGDANYDYVVDNADIFSIAAAYSTPNGYVRSNASLNWVPQYSQNWPSYVVSTLNCKHADCNGDGIIDANDTLAVSLNYSLTHPKENGQAQAKVTGLPDLYPDLTGLSFTPGASVSIPIKLGSLSEPMQQIWGIAATFKISGINPIAAPEIDFTGSWIGSSNTLTFSKAIGNSKSDWTIARTVHSNISGSGMIATVHFTIPANTPNSQKIVFSLEHVSIVDSGLNPVTAFNIILDSATVSNVGISSPSIHNDFSISPTPAHGFINVTTNQIGELLITDLAGRLIKKFTITGNKQYFELGNIASGMYLSQFIPESGIMVKGKIIIE